MKQSMAFIPQLARVSSLTRDKIADGAYLGSNLTFLPIVCILVSVEPVPKSTKGRTGATTSHFKKNQG